MLLFPLRTDGNAVVVAGWNKNACVCVCVCVDAKRVRTRPCVGDASLCKRRAQHTPREARGQRPHVGNTSNAIVDRNAQSRRRARRSIDRPSELPDPGIPRPGCPTRPDARPGVSTARVCSQWTAVLLENVRITHPLR